MRYVLKDLIVVSKDGEWGKCEPFESSLEMHCIRGTDFAAARYGEVAPAPRRHIAGKAAERKKLQPWDILIEVAGGTKDQITGRTVLLRPQLFSRSKIQITCASFSRFVRLRADLCDPEFIFWYMQHLYAGGQMHQYHTQHTGVARFQWTTFSENEPFDLPSMDAQRRIAGILSAYDDLIENCQRRIRVLEDMARGLYREWFVHFRFPGGEALPRVESPLGLLPQGWGLTDMAGLCASSGIQTGPFGSQLHESDYADEGVPVVMPRDLIGFRITTEKIARIPEKTAEQLQRHRMLPGDIVYGRRGDIGRRAFVMPEQRGWFCGTGCLRVRPDPKKVNGWFLFNYLGQDDVADLIAKRAHGATMPNLNTKLLATVPVATPPRAIQNEFEDKTLPLARARELLFAKIENLRRTRDLLLPRLMSCQISLSEAEEAAA